MQNAISQLKLRVCLTLETGDSIHHLVDVKMRQMFVRDEHGQLTPATLDPQDAMIYNSSTDIAGHARLGFKRGNNDMYFDISELGDKPLLVKKLYFKIDTLPTKQQLENLRQSIVSGVKFPPLSQSSLPDSGFTKVLTGELIKRFSEKARIIYEPLN